MPQRGMRNRLGSSPGGGLGALDPSGPGSRLHTSFLQTTCEGDFGDLRDARFGTLLGPPPALEAPGFCMEHCVMQNHGAFSARGDPEESRISTCSRGSETPGSHIFDRARWYTSIENARAWGFLPDEFYTTLYRILDTSIEFYRIL